MAGCAKRGKNEIVVNFVQLGYLSEMTLVHPNNRPLVKQHNWTDEIYAINNNTESPLERRKYCGIIFRHC